MRRFINADWYASIGQGYTSYNMFAYCLNNPVIYVDSDGREPDVAWEWWLTFGDGLSVVDGPLPIGDIVLVGGCLVLGTECLFYPEPEPLKVSIDIPNVLFEEENGEETYDDEDYYDDDYDGLDDYDDEYIDDEKNYGGREPVGKSNGDTPRNNKV